jgi:fructokinase
MSSARPQPSYLVFGEALTDLVRIDGNTWHSAPGGSCWNVARVASTLGLPTAWCGAVSKDLFGRQIVEQSEAAGLDTRFIQMVDRPPLLAVVHQTHPPQYFFIGDNAADLAFDESGLPDGWEAGCRFAHFGCISLVRQPLGARLVELAHRLKQRGVRISFDANYRNLMGADYPQLFERMLAIADVAKISDEDLAAIYPQWSKEDALQRARAIAARAQLLYTQGSAGLSLFAPEGTVTQAAFKVDLRDTVGAGDACLGGFVASLLASPQADLATHARFAAATAAVTCAHVGAYAPSRDEVEQLLARPR